MSRAMLGRACKYQPVQTSNSGLFVTSQTAVKDPSSSCVDCDTATYKYINEYKLLGLVIITRTYEMYESLALHYVTS